MKDILDKFRTGRHEFENGRLEDIHDIKPYDLFEEWMTAAVEAKEIEPNAFVLSTVDAEGQPSSRIVYLKDMIDGEFVLYTNYNSDKGKDLEENKQVSMLFFWGNSSRQIRIKGVCTKLDAATSDAYFATRPRYSKLGAWASDQSDRLVSREYLENKVKELDEQFGEEIPRPDFWGGYKIDPTAFEFWQGRPSRLHDRIVFQKEDNSWTHFRINP
jgi:pyridoxamine 5'-phosphate oxidase